MRRVLLCTFAIAATAASTAHAWWNDDWALRKEIVLDTSATGADVANSVDDAVVLVRLHLGNFDRFAEVAPDGADLRFVAGDDVTPLSFHIERWDASAEMAFIWVRLPRLAGATNSERMYLYFGNPGAPPASDPSGTWDTDQVLVYHFADGAGAFRDSTAYANHPSSSGLGSWPAALIGAGARIDGSRLQVPGSRSLRLVPAEGMSLSLWLSIEGAQRDAVLVSIAGADADAVRLVIDDRDLLLERQLGGDVHRTPVESGRLTAGAWHHLALTIDVDGVTLYKDGAAIGGERIALPELAGGITVGAMASGARATRGITLDEFTVSATERSPDWIRAVAAGQGIGSSMLRYGETQPQGGTGEPSYFLITLQNLTFDGWVVIALLIVMALISWVVIAVKAIFVSRVRRANTCFQQIFAEHAATDLVAIDDPAFAEQDLEFSTLRDLYAIALRETERRVAGATVGAAHIRGLTDRGLTSIRAALDAEDTRQNQRLNAQMVLLTIAISGGPFLGLLGTVVGVMITFAAIAHTGEVDVSAIAPGTAAALAATVAGLAVAIPALFAYNYIGTRIREITVDGHVFIDELVNRLGEIHAE